MYACAFAGDLATCGEYLQIMLQIRYNERFVEELHLPVEKLDFGQDKPPIQTIDACPPVARPILQQDLHFGLPVTATPKLPQVKKHPLHSWIPNMHSIQSELFCFDTEMSGLVCLTSFNSPQGSPSQRFITLAASLVNSVIQAAPSLPIDAALTSLLRAACNISHNTYSGVLHAGVWRDI